jgi:hypothetical protein
MAKLTRKEFNCETGEETIFELTAEEVKAYEAEQAQLAIEKAAKEAEELAKAQARTSALAKLGLTAEEAAALLG